jgi:hypothetical protein
MDVNVGEAIGFAQDASSPDIRLHCSSGRETLSTGAEMKTPLASTAPLAAPCGNTAIANVRTTVKPLDDTVTRIRQVEAVGFDQLVAGAVGEENADSAQSELHA